MASPDEINPYAAPQTPLVAQAIADGEVWRDGTWLVCRKQAQLPSRCIKCNAPADGPRLNKKFYWHPPAFYLIIIINLFIYVIVAMIVRKTAKVGIKLCDQHASRRRTGIAMGWILFVVGIVVMFAMGTVKGDAAFIFLFGGIGLMIAAAVVGIATTQTLRPKKIDDYFAWFTGVCPEYLAELPDSPVQRW
jgi:hypothetical protein